jgi:LuxR family maltose regulon positive regulatory protein
MARLYLLKKDEKKARSFINESLKLAEKYSYDFLLTDTLKRYYEIIRFIKKAKFKSPYLQHIILQLPYSETITSSIEPDPKEYDFIFTLFGKTRVFIHGREIKTNRLRTRKFQEIFAFFITHPKQTMTREKIIYTFWPDHNPSTSKQLFYNALYWIRKAVDKNIIVYNSLGYTLSSKFRYWIDTEEFEKLTKAGDRLVQDGNLGAGLIKYEEAISLYRDGFMEDFYSNWCQDQRKYYEEVYLDVLRKLSYGHHKIGSLQKAVHFCNCIIRKDPYDEAAYCLTMRCYASLNDVQALQNCYATLEKTLARELKTTPSVETTRLFETLTKKKIQHRAHPS